MRNASPPLDERLSRTKRARSSISSGENYGESFAIFAPVSLMRFCMVAQTRSDNLRPENAQTGSGGDGDLLSKIHRFPAPGQELPFLPKFSFRQHVEKNAGKTSE